MDFTWKEILTYLFGSGTIVGGAFVGIKFIYEQIDKRRAGKRTSEEKAYDAVWKLYEAAKAEVEKLKEEIEELEKGDSLSRPAISKIYQAVRKLGRQMEIIETIFIKEFTLIENEECRQISEALKKEMDILWQKFDDLEKCLP